MSTCKSCGARIVWAKTTTGKSMPLDPDPVAGGNVVLERDGVGWVARIVQPDPEFERLVSHFATCPNAKAHRKDRQAEHALQDAKREMFGDDADYLDDVGAR